MADTNYVDFSVPAVNANWLNDTNIVVYRALGVAGVAPATPAQVMANLGAATAASVTAVSAGLAAPGGSALIGFLRAGAGAVAQTVNKKLLESVSVKDFGAVCDGVTDDTAAINLAAAAVRLSYLSTNSQTGNVLTFPFGGTCSVSGTLDFSGISVDGFGFNLSGFPHIKATSAQFDVIKSSGRTAIHNLFVDGGWDQVTAGQSGDAMSFINGSTGFAYDIYLHNVAIFKAKKRGIYWEGSGYGCIDRPQISSVGLHALEIFSVDGAHTCTTVRVTGKGTLSNAPNGYGVKLTSCIAMDFDSVIMEATKGIQINGTGNRTININKVYQESGIGLTFLDCGISDGVGLSVVGCTGGNKVIPYPTNWVNVEFGANAILTDAAVPFTGRVIQSDSGQLTTTTTGGFNFTANTLSLPPGTWMIDATMQTLDSAGSVAVQAGIKLTGAVTDSGLNNQTGANFTEGCDEANSFGSGKDARLHAFQIYQNQTTAAVTFYLRGFINISAGTIAYRSFVTAVKMQ